MIVNKQEFPRTDLFDYKLSL